MATLHWAERKSLCMDYGLKLFLDCEIFYVINLILIIKYIFFNKQKSDQTDATLNLGKFAFDNENHERKSLKIFGHS